MASLYTEQDYQREGMNQVGSEQSGGGNYHSALMLVFLLSSTGVALAFVPVLMSSNANEITTSARNITQPLAIINSFTMSVLCLYFVIKKKTWQNTGKVRFLQRKPSRQQSCVPRQAYSTFDANSIVEDNAFQEKGNMPLIQLIVFGIGACLWLVFSIITDLNNYKNISHNYMDLLSLLDEMFYMLTIAIHVLFLTQYNDAILPNSSIFHYSIALMIADKVWVWLTVTLSGLNDFSSHETPNISQVTAHPIDNLNKNAPDIDDSTEVSFYKVSHFLLIFLEPFFIEFLTISIGSLFQMWHNIGNTQRQGTSLLQVHNGVKPSLSHDISHDYSYLINEESQRKMTRLTSNAIDATGFDESEGFNLLGSNHGKNRSQGKKEKLLMGIYIAFITLVAVSVLFTGLMWNHGPFSGVVDTLHDITQYFLYRGVQIASFLPFSIAALVSVCKIYHKNPCWSVSFTSSDYLLFFTAAVHFVYFILKGMAAATILGIGLHAEKRGESMFVLVYSTACIIQVWIQTQLLLATQSVQRLRRQNSKFTRMCLMYLVFINIGMWLQMAISREASIHEARFYIPALEDCFGEVTSRILLFLFYPAMELYRFHSAFIAYEILA